MIWGAVKFAPGGHATFFGFVNSFTHMAIYGYLVLIGACPKLKRNFSWFRTFHSIMTVSENQPTKSKQFDKVVHLQAAEIITVLLHASQLVGHNTFN